MQGGKADTSQWDYVRVSPGTTIDVALDYQHVYKSVRVGDAWGLIDYPLDELQKLSIQGLGMAHFNTPEGVKCVIIKGTPNSRCGS